ncbi:RagB/SusD family nutrient uptake outer membrane protein [Pedobacter gandavensis]|uniref:RagB/SusD family nutrient uptake outer membrane protein n=1 Tax=Pedobacter gandavensis TaxID=2679963 RepID=UPI00292E4848|nr:RagB/SusD family nutrient uptake outer membrane protein [Pedobacter gandavensis]
MRSYINILFFIIILGLSSCEKFLDKSPNSKQAQVSTLADCQALLDDFNTMNASYPNDNEASCDNYYLLDATWTALANQEDRDFYVWAAGAQHLSASLQWAAPYKAMYYSNLVLENLQKINSSDVTLNNTLRGSALFFRAFTAYSIAQLYAKPYNIATAGQDMGIPFRTTTALEVESERSTVKETYDKIVQDLNEAIPLLPVNSSIQTRPNKVAAYALLARVYLSMEDYINAGKMADESLKLYNVLMDYNSLDARATVPIARFNPEVIFHAVTIFSDLLHINNAKIDQILYDSYLVNDLRKTVFFRTNTVAQGGGFGFKGNYNGLATSILFCGLATDETYLIRAECYARAGNKESALADLNALLKMRWNPNATVPSNPYVDITASNAEDALKIILTERRKELLYRCLRWTDLRRLNRDNRFKIDLVRKQNGNGATIATLPANDLRYVLLIPQDVMTLTKVQQNPRN